MPTLRHEWFNVGAHDVFRIYPLGDIHIGVKACDEKLFMQTVKEVADDPCAYWIGMGDYLDAVNRTDPRFDPSILPDWMTMADLSDIVDAQLRRFGEMIEPIASKCLGLLCGNHESAITRHYERDAYREVVRLVKALGGFGQDHKLALGYYGWLALSFFYSDKRTGGSRQFKLNLHHGFGGGKLSGSKALNLERWLWTHEADLVIFGHTHSRLSGPVGVEYLDRGNKVRIKERKGVYSGTFLRGNTPEHDANTYPEVKGMLPMAHGHIMVEIVPRGDAPIHIIT